jgi:hypothetical protein
MEDIDVENFTVEIIINGVTKRVGFPPDSTVDFVEEKMRSMYNVANGALSSSPLPIPEVVNRVVAGGSYYFVEFIPLGKIAIFLSHVTCCVLTLSDEIFFVV